MCNNNCCMCCNCNTNTNNEETPQEVVYTAVCNSVSCLQNNQCGCCCKCCNCEKYKAHCEDDPENMVLALQEHMEDCCTQVGERLDTVECELEREIDRSKTEDKKHDDQIADLYYKESLDFNKSVFNPQTNKIEFWHEFYNEDHEPMPDKPAIHFTEWDIDASNFLKDWFIDDAELISNRYLELTFNNDPITDPDHNPIKITIDLYDFIDPGLYYTKTEIDQKLTQINNTINTISTNLTNLKNSITGYDPELPYDGTSVTVGQADGKSFKVHLATFPELVSTVTPDYANNRFVVTTNKGNTNYVELKNSTYETIQHAADTYETINHASTTYETKVDAANHYKNATINDHTITLTRQDNTTTVINLPDNNTDTLVKQKNCIDDAAIPVLLAYSANPTNNTAGEAFYSGVTINPHTTIINGIADKAIKDDDGNNIADTYVSGGSFNNSNRNLTLVNPAGTTLATINIPDADANKYVTGGSVSNNQLTLTYNDNTTAPAIDLSSIVLTDHNNYVDTATLGNNNILSLGRTGGLSPVTVDLSSLANGVDQDHYPTAATLSGNTLTFTGNSGFTPFSVDLSNIAGAATDYDHYSTSGTYSDSAKKITISGNSGFSSFDIDLSALVARIEALEGLWEVNPNNSNQVIAKSGRSAMAAGFYDSTVS